MIEIYGDYVVMILCDAGIMKKSKLSFGVVVSELAPNFACWATCCLWSTLNCGHLLLPAFPYVRLRVPVTTHSAT